MTQPKPNKAALRTKFAELLANVPAFEGGVVAAPPWDTKTLVDQIDALAPRIKATPEYLDQMRGLAERLTRICYGYDFGVLWVPPPQIDLDGDMEFAWIHLKRKSSLSFWFEGAELVMTRQDGFKVDDTHQPTDEAIVEGINWILAGMDISVTWDTLSD